MKDFSQATRKDEAAAIRRRRELHWLQVKEERRAYEIWKKLGRDYLNSGWLSVVLDGMDQKKTNVRGPTVTASHECTLARR